VLNRKVEKIGGLFERTGAVGHHHAGNVRVLGKDLVDAVRQREQVVERDVGATDINDLLDLHVGILADFRNRLDELLAENCASLVFGQIRRGGARARDGPSSGEHPNQW
jgi:hypothetical protein